MASEQTVTATLRRFGQVLCKAEMDLDTRREWILQLRDVDDQRLRLATDVLCQTIERMPTLASVRKACKCVKIAADPVHSCPDCQQGLRAGFYRLTFNRYDEEGQPVGTIQRHAEVILACTCTAGDRYADVCGRWDAWKMDAEAKRKPETSDAVWVADRHERAPTWALMYPDRPPPSRPLRAVGPWVPLEAVRPAQGRQEARIPVPESWRGDADEMPPDAAPWDEA